MDCRWLVVCVGFYVGNFVCLRLWVPICFLVVLVFLVVVFVLRVLGCWLTVCSLFVGFGFLYLVSDLSVILRHVWWLLACFWVAYGVFLALVLVGFGFACLVGYWFVVLPINRLTITLLFIVVL